MRRKSYYPSGDPEQCTNHYTQRGQQGQITQRTECHAKALWKIGPHRLCYGCFERYITEHDVDHKFIIRLSDDERDFIERFALRRGVRKVDNSPMMREAG